MAKSRSSRQDYATATATATTEHQTFPLDLQIASMAFDWSATFNLIFSRRDLDVDVVRVVRVVVAVVAWNSQ